MKRDKFQDIFTVKQYTCLHIQKPGEDPTWWIPISPRLNANSTERGNIANCWILLLIQNTVLLFSSPNANLEMELWCCRGDGYTVFLFASIPWWWNGDCTNKEQVCSPLTWLTVPSLLSTVSLLSLLLFHINWSWLLVVAVVEVFVLLRLFWNLPCC